MDLKSKIREVENFPKKGIGFKDITTLLQDPDAFCYAIDEMKKRLNDVEYDVIVGPEARGFILGTPLAYATKKPFAPVRKTGKLPYKTESYTYDLEYGSDTLQMHTDAIKPGDKVVIVDDLLATGGTVSAVAKLVEKLGGCVVGIVFLIELCFLNGSKKLQDYQIDALIKYED